MKAEFLHHLIALNDETFAEMMSRFGFGIAACYRIKGAYMNLVLGSRDGDIERTNWPATFKLETNFFGERRHPGLPIGWFKPTLSRKLQQQLPKRCYFYSPEQELSPIKLVFVVQRLGRKNFTNGELDGALEAVSSRIRTWFGDTEMRHFISEAILEDHARKVGIDTQKLIDHELRTPLSVITGYAHMIGDLKDKVPVAEEVSNAIRLHSETAIRAIEKLALALKSGFDSLYDKNEMSSVNLNVLLKGLVEEVREAEMAEPSSTKDPKFSVLIPEDLGEITIRGVEKLVYKALWEVLQNAVSHAEKGQIKVGVYLADDKAVIEIEDDGPGVPEGSEDLIFLRFYKGVRDTRVRRGHRGLGLGLYMARHIAEQHLGELNYIRLKNRGCIFRFFWPLTDEYLRAREDQPAANVKLVG